MAQTACFIWNLDGSKALVPQDWNVASRIVNADGSLHATLESSFGDRCAAWSPDGKRVVTLGFNDRVGIWSEDGRQLGMLDESVHGTQPSWSSDGKWFVNSGRDKEYLACQLYAPDGSTGQVLGTFATQATDFAPHENRLAVASNPSRGQDLHLFRGNQDGSWRETLRRFSGHDKVTWMKWDPTGKFLATTGGDCTLIVRSNTALEPLWRAVLVAPDAAITLAANGDLLSGDPEIVEKHLIYHVEYEDGRVELLRHSEFDKLRTAAGVLESARVTALNTKPIIPKIVAEIPKFDPSPLPKLGTWIPFGTADRGKMFPGSLD